ncbi:MAG: tRNA (guanosine(46)-N7)-methyltransferase TrmB [Firmicutes bacterium]|nr:tRNA (guanosine(46)-N7)-methyltransferase TrmB [Bacillota bacterium]
MRQRGVKNRDAIVQSCSAWLAEDPMTNRGSWRSLFGSDAPLCLEIGSGKGKFICGMAKAHPDINFLACEGGENINVRVLQKASEAELANLRLIDEYIIHPCDYFAEGELDGLYLNFSDPWPKARHAHRRLTHHRYLEEYKKIIRHGGFLAFKTDNDDLFAFSLEEFALAGLTPVRLTRDLHNSCWNEENITTEYEEKFSQTGKSINYAYILMP